MADLENITFEKLPEAVSQLIKDVTFIKNHILNESAQDDVQTNIQSENELLTVRDVCKKLQISKGGLYNLTCSRQIPCFKRGGRLYFDAQELNEWIRSDRRKTLKELQEEAYLCTRNNNNFSK